MRYCEENNIFFRLNGELIKQLRIGKGLSQQDLATDLCMEQYQVSNIENGKCTNPRYSMLYMIAHYFEKDIAEIIISEKG